MFVLIAIGRVWLKGCDGMKTVAHTVLLPAQRRVPSLATVTLAIETSSSGTS